MTKTATTCSQGPNNFAMIPRIARLELKGNEFLLYATYVDIANPKTGRAQMSNKRLAKAVGCTVKTLKKHRNRLQELGYIRLFYRDCDGNRAELDIGSKIETSTAIIVEVVDVWEANCQFSEVLKQSRDEKVAVLKNFLTLSDDIDSEEVTEGDVKSTPLSEVDDTPKDGKDVIGVVKKIPPSELTNDVAGDVKNTPHKIKKDLLQENIKETNSAERGDDFLLPVFDEIFADDEREAQTETHLEPDTIVTETNTSDVHVPEDEPAGEVVMDDSMQDCTPEEREHFGDSVSGDLLETYVFNPCHNTFMPRDSFKQPTVQHSDWQQLVTVVQHFFGVSSAGYAAKIAQQLAGTATSGLRKEFACDPPMDAVTACAFGYWLREAEGLEALPQRAERIQERAFQFRELPDVFAHTNYARYVLMDLLASLEPQTEPEIDPELLKPAPKDVLDKAYAEAEALLGFSLSGDF